MRLESLNPDDLIWSGIDPPHVDEWSETKRLDFERKKMIKLNDYYQKQREAMGDNPDAFPRVFLREWGKGELQIFEE